jgi:hypothetical protein
MKVTGTSRSDVKVYKLNNIQALRGRIRLELDRPV